MSTVSDQPAAISCRDLWKVYGPTPDRYIQTIESGGVAGAHTAAVRGLSFDVEVGERFVVMGLSGSGKSTLVRCLTRLVEPTRGDVEIRGRSITSMGPKELREVRRSEFAMIFQHFALLGHRTVLSNAAYGLEVSGVPREEREARAREVLAKVGLAGREDKYPSELSGGMKQRVGLARALAVNPRLLFLDEPFSALDPLIRRDLQDELLRLAEDLQTTMVFITHDMTEALKLGDRIAIMRDGEIVQIGTPEQILMEPADDYVARFTADASRARIVRAHTVTAPAQVIRADASVDDVRAAIQGFGANHVLVTDDSQGVIGWTTLAAVTEQTRSGNPLPELRRVATVREDQTLHDVTGAVVADEGPIAVLDADGRLMGVLDTRLLAAALADVKSDVPLAVA